MTPLVILAFISNIHYVYLASCRVPNCRENMCSGNNCNGCIDKYYLQQGNCYPCPTQCNTCIEFYLCTNCISNRYGNWCQGDCSECRNQQCAACTHGCQDGKYLYTDNLCYNCPSLCTKCNSYSECTQCVDQKWGTSCKYSCYGCARDCSIEQGCPECKNGFFRTFNSAANGFQCTQCRDSCRTCESYYNCSSCEAGFWGTYCQNSCELCSGTCDKTNACVDGCVSGYYIQNIGSLNRCIVCPVHCKTCTSSSRCSGCELGFAGISCQKDCRNCNGYLCHDESGECSIVCTVSQFYDETSTSCKQCPSECLNCKNLTHCDSCKEGRFGQVCQHECSNTCLDRACSKDTGYCYNCIDGYYGSRCSLECMSNCRSCSDASSCNTCKKEFFNSGSNNRCDCSKESCISTENDKCILCELDTFYPFGKGCCPCNSNCKDNLCYSNQTCIDCPDRKYGDKCTNVCSQWCSERKCDRDGTCLSCPDQQYGNSCQYWCSNAVSNCRTCHLKKDMQVVCEKCNDGMYFSENRCVYCRINCAYPWPSCNASTGVCLHGCKSGWFGEYCDSRCNISYCQSCTRNVNICNDCNIGYYLLNNICSPCPENCAVKHGCNKHNGSCTEGCLDGWSGTFCNKSCFSHCIKCDQFNENYCTDCRIGSFGNQCENHCSRQCDTLDTQQTCEQVTGECIHGCVKGFWGKTCEESCGPGCNGSICNRTNGHCLGKCLDNYYNESCGSICSVNCNVEANRSFERICDKDNGECLFGCNNGYYGQKCEQECNLQCKNNTCIRSNGTCTFGCKDGFTGATCTEADVSDYQASREAAAIGAGAGAGVSLLVAVVIVFTVFVLRKRRNSSKLTSNCSEVSPANQDLEPPYSNIEDSRIQIGQKEIVGISNQLYANTNVRMSDISKRDKQTSNDFILEEIDGEPIEVEETSANTDDDRTYYNTGGKRVQVAKLEEYVQHERVDEMIEDFNKLPKGLLKSYKEAKKSTNLAKNRYRAIYPYDETRVILSDGGSDYINASYIEGYNKPKEFIASSGPFCKSYDTTPDFWRMIWQEKCKTLVMLTNLIEHEEVKCVKYWPDLLCTRDFEDIHVTCLAEDIYSDFTIRVLAAKKGRETLNIHHLHFTAWPDKGVPHDVTSMIEFRQKVRSIHKKKTCSMLVHCSAGIGRTGTFILLDILTCEGEGRGSVDIFGSVTSLRYQRCNMVQTLEQYIYLHHAVLHSLTFDCRSIPGDMFLQNYNKLLERNGGQRTIDKQFVQLKSIAEEITNDEKTEIERNKAMSDKNRKCADVPWDEYRVKLHDNRKPGTSDYINAVYINSFRRRRKFIAAQTPLPSTVVDFLSLIQQEGCWSVVSMEEADLEDKTVKVYWPADNQVVKHGVFKLSCKESQTTNHYVLKKLTMTYHGPQMGEETRDFNLFIFTKWPKGEQVPNTSDSLCEFVRLVDVENRSSGSEPPILVHCKTGAERSCLYCAVSVLIEKMEIDNEVSVVNTLRQIKARRRSAISSIEQYKFCHQAVISYLQSFETYSNFGLRDSSTV